MNLKQSYKGFQKTKWDNKSTRDRQKGLQKQYEKLGLKVPKYLQKNTLSETNFNKALNRINNVYTKRIEKTEPKVKLSDLQYLANKHNALIDRKLKQLSKEGYSEKTLDFLKGDRIYLEITDRAIMKNGALLQKIDLTNYHATQEGIKTYMKQIEEKTKKLRNLDLINNEENKLKNISNLANILNNEEMFLDSDISNIEFILNKFSNLNNVQQEVALNSIIAEFREKYKGEELEGEHMLNTLNKLSRNLEYVKENV